MVKIRGYKRADGSFGIRNIVLVISGDLCCNPWSQDIASSLGNCSALMHKHGVGNYAPDRKLFNRLMTGITVHPNVAGFVFVSSGNEDYDPNELTIPAKKKNIPFYIVSARNVKSASTLLRKGKEYAERLVRMAVSIRRVETGIDKLRIGLNCAGTDLSSAVTSHAILAQITDHIVSGGGTVIAGELPDFIGIEEELYKRCETSAVCEKLKTFMKRRRAMLEATGETIDDIEMVRFNVEGGLTTLEKKAHVSVKKTGTGMIHDVIEYGQIPLKTGLIFMDSPAMTDFVMTGFLGAGVHVMINTCGSGEGNKMPFAVGADNPSPLMPVIKMTGSTYYFRQKINRIDFNAATLADGSEETELVMKRLLRMIACTASGKQTKTETGNDYLLNIPVSYHQA
ncbi:UxaA family hydrolase [Candidatus Latescibacterota bacterium]